MGNKVRGKTPSPYNIYLHYQVSLNRQTDANVVV